MANQYDTTRANALGFAVKYGKPVSFEGTAATGRFVIDGQHHMRADEIDGLVALAGRMGYRVDADELRAMIPAADTHPLGRVIETRTREIESAGFLGTGAGVRTVKEALVELAADWEDWSGQFVVTHPAGARVWVSA